MRNAGAVIHSHSLNAVMATMLDPESNEFVITHVEMIKGIEGHGFYGEAASMCARGTRRVQGGRARTLGLACGLCTRPSGRAARPPKHVSLAAVAHAPAAAATQPPTPTRRAARLRRPASQGVTGCLVAPDCAPPRLCCRQDGGARH
jgi:hypothetical protein